MDASFAILRDRKTGTAGFRRAAHVVCGALMEEMQSRVKAQVAGEQDIVIVLILRAGIAFFEAAIRVFPDAPVGVLGLKRNEQTLDPHWYYENLPSISGTCSVVILDPMLATGGSAEMAVERLEKRGADLKHTYFAGVVAAPEGIARLAELIPRENIVLAAVDEGLDEHGMIVPGVGDFGDRYFGYVGRAIIGS